MTILEEAQQIISGERREAYGPPDLSFTRIAAGWTAINGNQITPQQVILMMIWLKVCRESNKHQKDNLTDIAGYAALLSQLEEDTKPNI